MKECDCVILIEMDKYRWIPNPFFDTTWTWKTYLWLLLLFTNTELTCLLNNAMALPYCSVSANRRQVFCLFFPSFLLLYSLQTSSKTYISKPLLVKIMASLQSQTNGYPADNYPLDRRFIHWIGLIHWIAYPCTFRTTGPWRLPLKYSKELKCYQFRTTHCFDFCFQIFIRR
jgi:hypothetical protein